MEQKVEQAYLYDFYGELLNAHQQKIYEDVIFHDLSLGEIAQEEGISRQAVHDVVRRCTKTLEGYEEKLHLLQKFLSIKECVAQIHALTGVPGDSQPEGVGPVQYPQVLQQIAELSSAILDQL